MIVAGVLSGTSLDGIDVAIVDIGPDARRLVAFETVEFDANLRARILAAFPPARADALAFAALHADVGAALGAAVCRVAGDRDVALIGSHGVTLAHDGAARHSWQIGDAFSIREATGVTVAFDFRAADCAAGGQGAPLVPYLDAVLFADPHVDRVALNLGGIANLSILRAGSPAAETIAFDSGPANLPLDTYVAARGLGNGRYDRDGELALAGSVDAALLACWLHDPYFALDPPKSTGRERFGRPFIDAYRAQLASLSPPDALATLTALSVTTIVAAVERFAPAKAELIVSGGGVHNAALMAGLRAGVAGRQVDVADRWGVRADAKEAVLFATLAYELIRGRPANVPNVTGARGPRLLGALAPADLAGLIAAVQREETS